MGPLPIYYMCNVFILQVPCGIPPVTARARNPRHVPRRARQLHAVVHPVGHHQRHLRELAADPEVVMTHTRVVNRNDSIMKICRLEIQRYEAVIETMLRNVVFAVDFFRLIISENE